MILYGHDIKPVLGVFGIDWMFVGIFSLSSKIISFWGLEYSHHKRVGQAHCQVQAQLEQSPLEPDVPILLSCTLITVCKCLLCSQLCHWLCRCISLCLMMVLKA